MKEEEIPKNTMIVEMELLDDGNLRTAFGHNFDLDLVEDESVQYLLDILNGIRISLDNGMEQFANQGAMARTIRDLVDELDGGMAIEFEPDEELLEALNDKRGNIVQFDPKKRH
jgi:hypothetical protein